jgi:hypothetical protein
MKKVFTLFLAASFFCFLTLPTGATLDSSEYPRAANTNDAMDILRHVAGVVQLPYERRWQLDFDRDGIITTADSLVVLNSLAGFVELPVIPPIPKGVEPMTEEMELRVKTDWLKQYLCESYPVHLRPEEGYNVDNVLIISYFGTYSGSVTLIITDAYTRTAGSWSVEIAGYNFDGSLGIMVWNNGDFYSLSKAYDEGFLVENNISNIHFHYINRNR